MADAAESESINYRRLFGVSHGQQRECGETKVCGVIDRRESAAEASSPCFRARVGQRAKRFVQTV